MTRLDVPILGFFLDRGSAWGIIEPTVYDRSETEACNEKRSCINRLRPYTQRRWWVLYALLLPLYKPGHFIMAAAASVVVFLIARILCKDVVEEVEEKPPAHR